MPNYRRHRVHGSSYFFTAVTARRRPILDRALVPLLRESVREVRTRMPFEIEAWVALTDHMHAIWRLPEGDDDHSKRWGLIKAASPSAAAFRDPARTGAMRASGNHGSGNTRSAMTRTGGDIWTTCTSIRSSMAWSSVCAIGRIPRFTGSFDRVSTPRIGVFLRRISMVVRMASEAVRRAMPALQGVGANVGRASPAAGMMGSKE